MSKQFKFFNGSIYHNIEDFSKRCKTRRVTFGYSIYARKRISIFSRLSLIWTAFFTHCGGKMRTDYYFKKYLDRELARRQRFRIAQRIINYDDPKFSNIVSLVIAEKAELDNISNETGQKFIN